MEAGEAMVSDLFMKDYRQMSAQGVEFTPADIIRLNALAVKVKLTARPVGAVHLRRAVFWGDLAFREPTLGHDMWIERVGTFIDLSAERNFRAVHAYALTRDHTELPNAYRPERCIKAVFDFARRHLVAMTSALLADIIDYVLFGADWTATEMAPPKPRTDANPDFTDAPESPALGVFIGATARRIGLSIDDAKRLTASEIHEAVERIDIMDRRVDVDHDRNAAFGAYVRAREEIRARARTAANQQHSPNSDGRPKC